MSDSINVQFSIVYRIRKNKLCQYSIGVPLEFFQKAGSVRADIKVDVKEISLTFIDYGQRMLSVPKGSNFAWITLCSLDILSILGTPTSRGHWIAEAKQTSINPVVLTFPVPNLARHVDNEGPFYKTPVVLSGIKGALSEKVDGPILSELDNLKEAVNLLNETLSKLTYEAHPYVKDDGLIGIKITYEKTLI